MKNTNIVKSLKNAVSGIVYAISSERNLKVHTVMAVVVLVAAILLKVTVLELIALFLVIGLVMVCELMNTVMEVLLDTMVRIYHPKVKVIKDISAGAVLISAVTAIIVGFLVFYERINMLIAKLL